MELRTPLTPSRLRLALRGRRSRRGVGMFELLIALSIAATLLTATGVALDASFFSYRVNEEQSSLIQNARLTLNRITTSIRTSKAHQPHTAGLLPAFVSGNTVIDNGLDMFDLTNTQLAFSYDATAKTVSATYNGTKHVLAQGVTAFQITIEPMRSPEAIRTGGGCDLVQRATILMSIQTTAATMQNSETTSGQVITLSASVMPRRNTW
jgi:Tfp pilus assembly protein PilW